MVIVVLAVLVCSRTMFREGAPQSGVLPRRTRLLEAIQRTLTESRMIQEPNIGIHQPTNAITKDPVIQERMTDPGVRLPEVPLGELPGGPLALTQEALLVAPLGAPRGVGAQIANTGSLPRPL